MLGRIKGFIVDFFHQADLVLLVLCVFSTLCGLVLIASATHYMGTGNSLKMLIVQFAALCIGLGAYFFLTMIDVESLMSWWKWILVFNIGFICMLVPFGVERYGNKNWIQFSWMPTAIQPSEIVKITFILLLAKQLEWVWESRRDLQRFGSVIQPAAHLLFMVGLIYVVSSDMGSALVYVFIFLCMALAAGMAWRWFVLGLGGACGGVVLLYRFELLPSHMQNRFHVILDHSFDPMGVGFQQTRSLRAIGSGGWFGEGLFHGTLTQSGSGAIPFRYTDFIYAVAGEETGFFGCMFICLLLAAIVFRCLQVARHAKTPFSSYVCVGIAGMLIFQTVENIGMCLFVMPVIGLTLPFFSYGGSSIVTLFAAMGIVSGIKKRALS